MDHVASDVGADRCPWCGARAPRRWFPCVVGYEHKGEGEGAAWQGIGREAPGIALSFCGACQQPVIWHEQGVLWPAATSAPACAIDMPADVRADFEEARQIVDRSPRSAAALLRLCLLKLSRHLGRSDTGIGELSRSLVVADLPDAARQALQAVRAEGDAAAPGELDPRDDRKSALALFDLVNVVVERMISEPAAWRPRDRFSPP
jgi:hypothetical protein